MYIKSMFVDRYINKFINFLADRLGSSNENVKRYSSSSIWLIFEKIVTLGISFFIAIATARYFGPEQYGILTYAMTIYAIILNITMLGIDDLLLRDAILHEDKRDKILGTAFCIRSGFAIISYIGALIFGYITADRNTFIIIAIVSSAVIFQPITTITLYFMADIKANLRARAYISAYMITGVAKATIILTASSLELFAVAILFDTMLLVFFLVFFFRRNGYDTKKIGFDFTIFKTVINKGAPLALIFIISTIFVKTDIIMINFFLSEKELGLYSVSVKLMEVWQFIPIMLSTALFPALVKSRHNEKIFYLRLSHLYSLLLFGSILLALFTTIFAKYIIYIMFGEAYEGSVTSLRIIIWSLAFISLHQITFKYMMIDNLIKLGVYRAISGLIMNIILNIHLIPKFGINGAAVSTVISYAFMSYFVDIFNVKTRRIFFIKTTCLFNSFKEVIRSDRKKW